MLSIHKFIFCVVVTFKLPAQIQRDTLEVFKKDIFTVVNLTDDDFDDDNGEVSNITGIFAASNDMYLNTVGFEYQGVFYNVRGLGSDQVTFLLNGINQNRLYDDRPAWNNWGGIDGIYSTQYITAPLGVSEKTMGRALGVNALSTRASRFRKGARLSFARTNRSYQNKLAVRYAHGLPHDWDFALSASKRWGNEGFREGTFYDASSLMISVEKQIKMQHSINVSFLYTPNRRGLASTLTNEVINLKGNSYNANWGIQQGKKRNARVRLLKEPLILFTHNYTGNRFRCQNSLLLQKGEIGVSRIDYNGGTNPTPDYYQNLPSFWLSKNTIDYQNVFEYEQEFINKGQLDWAYLYKSNASKKIAPYVLYSDKREETRVQITSNFTKMLKRFWQFNGSFEYRKTIANNYAQVQDLFGGLGYLDVASFTGVQNNLKTPNRIVNLGDKFKYNYQIKSSGARLFTQLQKKHKKLNYAISLDLSQVNHQREGFYQHQNFITGYGRGQEVSLTALSTKQNLLYKFSGRHLLNLNSAYIQKSPSLKLVFPNARVSSNVLPNLDTENLFTNAASYMFRGLRLSAKFTAYYNRQSNVTETGFYFAEGFGNGKNNTAFVQEILSGIEKNYKGLEFSTTYKLSSALKLIGVLGIGDYKYGNNPRLVLSSDQITESQALGFENGKKDFGTAQLKNLKLSIGPHEAYTAMISYSDPNYWRIKVSINHFRNSFVDIAPVRYTQNFVKELDGSTLKGIDQEVLAALLTQEKLKNFTLVNLTGGKSWKLKKYYLSLFWSVQNLLGIIYKTGGFSSSRLINYTEQSIEYQRERPLFGTRYFVGNGRTFFTGLYFSF